jgi:hypothetical protein
LAPGAAALLVCGMLGGCALPGAGPPYVAQYSHGALVDQPAGLPASAHVQGVPFYADDRSYCGPASLASVLRFSGVPTTPQQLVPQVYTSKLDGTLQYDMLGATRRAGRVAYVIAPKLSALFAQVADGIPVVVLQKVGLGSGDWHFAVVTGYDLRADAVTLHSSTARDLVMSIDQFDRSWAQGQRWGFVALEPEQFPAGVTEFDALRAIAPLERVAPEAARQAYAAALQRWPHAWIAMMGLGNLAYARKDYARAAIHFAQASRAHPNDGDPLNNLAQALLAAGDLRAAHDTIAQAIRLGGPQLAVYKKTQAEIERAMRP